MTGTDEPRKPRPQRVLERKYLNVSFKAPAPFVALCTREGIAPAELVRQFIADLCDIRAWTASSAFAGSGDEAHHAALAYHAVAQKARKAKAATDASERVTRG